MVETKIDDIVKTVSTNELLARLAAYGVRREDLAYDCRHNYLPHPTVGLHPSGRGRGGHYDGLVVSRAKRLYRLRQLGCDPRTIRLWLFLKDGWGWEHIRADCIANARTVFGQSLNGLKRFTPKGGLDDAAVDNIVTHQHEALLRKFDEPPPGLKPTSEETTRFVLGTFGTGIPLEGGSAKRLMEPLARAFWPGIGRFRTWILCTVFDTVTGLMDLRSERMLERISNAYSGQLELGRKSFVYHLCLIRYVMRKYTRPKTKGACFSLITLGGQARNIDPNDFAKCGLSMYQALAAMVGLHIALVIAFDEFVETWRPMLPLLMRNLFTQQSHST